MNLKKKVLDNLPSMIVMIIFIIDFTFMLTIHVQWNKAIEKYIPLKNQIVLLRYNVTEAHLWLEEAIGGDQYIDVNKDVFPLFEHKNFHNLVHVKDKLTDSQGDKAILENFLKVDEQVDIIYSIALKRWTNNSELGIGSDADQIFDKHFNYFLDLTDMAIKTLEKEFERELQERDGYFKLVLAIFLAVNIFVYILLYSIKKSKKTTEQMLQKEQALATVTLKSIGDAVITVDKNARVTFLNTVAENLTGYITSQALNLPLGDVFNIINKITQLSVENPVDTVIKNGETVGLSNHTVLISKDGTRYDIADSAAPIHDTKGNIIGVVLVFRDVSNEYKIKEELENSEERFKALHEAGSGGIVIHEKGVILECNHRLTELFGYSYEELIGFNGLLLMSDDTRELVIENIKSGYEKPYKAFGIHKNGKKFPIRIEAREIMYKGEHTRVTEFNDITEEEKLNEKLSILNTKLEAKVQERTQKLEESFKSLAKTQEHLIQTEKMASLGSLVAGISHEINTPIGLGITSMTHFVSQTQKLKELYEKEEMEQEDFEEYLSNSDQLAQVTYENLKRAAELVKSFKQISIDQTSEEQREFNLQEYTNETLISLQNRIKKTDIKVEVNSPKTLNIYSYPGAFSQIITNLVMNSLIHAYDDKDSGLITLNFELEESNLLFTYTDDGKGISQEYISQIFDPFFTTNRAHGGSGLGLNIIYNIVTVQLKGTLECKSEQSQGTAFIMTIPINQGNKNNEI